MKSKAVLHGDGNKTEGDQPHDEGDPFSKAYVYRLRRDTLLIVSNMNRGRVVEADAVKKQIVFVQSQLCVAAVADPRLSENMKAKLVDFHASTILENLEDRRGSRRRHAR
jgi:hypothetical protein